MVQRLQSGRRKAKKQGKSIGGQARLGKVSKELKMIEGFFTDEQWNAIENALGDYGDYGDEQAEMASQIEDKIYSLFNKVN